MKIIFKNNGITIELSFVKTAKGFVISRLDKHSDREISTIDAFDSSWSEETIRFFFVSRINAIIANGGEIKDIEL